MQPYYTLKGSRSLLPSPFEVCGNPDAILSHFEGIKVPLPSLFKVCGYPDPTLSHFEGVEVTFA